MVERFLIGEIDGCLQCIELSAFNGIQRCLAVAAVTDKAGVAALPSAFQGIDHGSLAKFGFRTAVELDEIQMICFQAFETALDASEQRLGTPIGITPAAFVAAFCQEIKFVAPFPHCLADQLFAGRVTVGGVDNVNTGVDGFVQQLLDGPKGDMLIADLPTAET